MLFYPELNKRWMQMSSTSGLEDLEEYILRIRERAEYM